MSKWRCSLPMMLFIAILTACGGREIVEPLPGDDMVQNDADESEPLAAVQSGAEERAEDVAPALENSEETVGEPEATPLGEEAQDTVVVGGSADADVTWVRAVNNGDSWTFYVTVVHPDTGWEDYADGWDVVLPDGRVVKPDESRPFTRLLLHPHENEQPFTRSQSGIVIPGEVTVVTVRAHDLVAGFGGREVVVDLTTASGDGYEVEN